MIYDLIHHIFYVLLINCTKTQEFWGLLAKTERLPRLAPFAIYFMHYWPSMAGLALTDKSKNWRKYLYVLN